MSAIAEGLGTLADLALVVFGFGLIVFVHELGHFLAARWAGIRVLAFAVGFGPALVSFRKGLGWRRGSSELEVGPRGKAGVSPTEYRLNWLPFGGYVKMLGQEDLNPGAVSAAADSYQSCAVWKRMVVISAGVVMNLITAALLFIAVFMIGLRVEPAAVGAVGPESPAAKAVALARDGTEVRGVGVGLMPGDEIVSVAGRRPTNFSDVVVAAAMSERGRALEVEVRREGVIEPLRFRVTPEAGPTGLLELGIAPPVSVTVEDPSRASARAVLMAGLEREGLVGVEPGMRLTRVGAVEDPKRAHEVERVFEGSGGAAAAVVFEGEGRRVELELRPRAAAQVGVARVGGEARAVEHLLGLAGVMRVDPRAEGELPQGFAAGDIIARVGEVEYPTLAAGIAEVSAHAGRWVDAEVLRDPDADGEFRRVQLRVKVKRDGRIGLMVTHTLAGDVAAVRSGVLLAAVPARMTEGLESAAELELAARGLIDGPGQMLTHVGGRRVSTLTELRGALVEATRGARESGAGATVRVRLELPVTAPGSTRSEAVERDWVLTAGDVATLHELGWAMPFSTGVFAMEQMVDRASGPVAAVGRGLSHTRTVMAQTYLTFARLFQGTVKVEHLKGPVGIAHIGTRIADRGMIWLLFFLALISVNLAVINFLPLPIVDGGQFVMLVYEWVRGKPVPAGVQNAVTLAGLMLIGGMFLIVTFHDLKALLGG